MYIKIWLAKGGKGNRLFWKWQIASCVQPHTRVTVLFWQYFGKLNSRVDMTLAMVVNDGKVINA